MWNSLKKWIYLKIRRFLPGDPSSIRYRIGLSYLKGVGIEIGALHNPLPLPLKAKVTYVDRMTVADLRQHYTEFRNRNLAPVSIISNAEKLDGIPDRSQDFVIANHLIEHAQDPIGTLQNWIRVLRPTGFIYLSLPDKRFTFDRDRTPTSIDHLVADHRNGPSSSRRDHYREWVTLVNKTPADQIEKSIAQLDQSDYSIHFHVWDTSEFIAFLLHCRSELGLPFEIEHLSRNGNEAIFVLRKSQSDL